MSGVERDKLRIKETAEIFTPTSLVQEMLDKLEETDSKLFLNPNKTFLEPSCGDGQFLSEVIIRKMERSGCTLEQALSTTYGVELMKDNVKLCKERLAGPNPTMKIYKILNKNIVCHDALTYDYSFGKPVGIEWLLGGWRALKQVVPVMVVENFFSKINVMFSKLDDIY
jgi:adenine-specific DNA methylase